MMFKVKEMFKESCRDIPIGTNCAPMVVDLFFFVMRGTL